MKKKRKDDSSESELEEGELRCKSSQNTPEKQPSKTEERLSEQLEHAESEDKTEVRSMCNEVSSTTSDDNKQNTSGEEKTATKEATKDELKTENIDTDREVEVKENKPKEGKEKSTDVKDLKEEVSGSSDEKERNPDEEKENIPDEEKENKPTSGKNGEIKVVEQAKLVNDYIEIEESDDYLMYLEEILRKIHKFYYEIVDGKQEEERDLKKVIVI